MPLLFGGVNLRIDETETRVRYDGQREWRVETRTEAGTTKRTWHPKDLLKHLQFSRNSSPTSVFRFFPCPTRLFSFTTGSLALGSLSEQREQKRYASLASAQPLPRHVLSVAVTFVFTALWLCSADSPQQVRCKIRIRQFTGTVHCRPNTRLMPCVVRKDAEFNRQGRKGAQPKIACNKVGSKSAPR